MRTNAYAELSEFIAICPVNITIATTTAKAKTVTFLVLFIYNNLKQISTIGYLIAIIIS